MSGRDQQIGYFEIDQSNIDSSEFIVPSDKTGNSPNGNSNPNQESYDISSDGEGHDYYVHVVNDLDVNVDWNIKESHMFDRALDDAVDVFGTDETVNSGGDTDNHSGESNGSYFGVSINPASDPTSGTLKVIIQKSSV